MSLLVARHMEDHPRIAGIPLGSCEDRELTLAFQAGEKGAYQAIYERHSGRVMNVCRRMLPHSQDANDAMQETFLRVYQALGRFNGRYQLGAWITRIATNVCLDYLRAAKRRPSTPVSFDEYADELSEEIDVDGPDEIVIRRFEGRRVRGVLASLPPMHRAAIILRDFEGLSYDEVAVVLGMSPGQVKALIHRARHGFKRSWTALGASIFVPATWFHRIRKINAPHKQPSSQTVNSAHQLAESLTATAGPAASSCSSVLAQCGQFVADKLAPALAAVAVGAASITGFAGASEQKPPQDRVVLVEPDEGESRVRFVTTSRSHPKDGQEKSDSESPTETPVEPPVPAPAPSSDPAESDGGGNQSEPSDSEPAPKPTPTPAPLAASIGFEQGGPATVPSSERTSLDCSGRSIDQSLVTRVWTSSGTYDATFYLTASGARGRVEMTLTKNGRRYTYLSWGTEPVASWTEGPKSTQLSITGEFGPAYGNDPESAGLPGAGSFEALLSLDCSSSSVVSESVIFDSE